MGGVRPGADVLVRAHGGVPRRLTGKGWSKPLELDRLFLSYSELGALVSGHPSREPRLA